MSEERRPDLAAMLFPLGRVLIAIEEPILSASDLSMWAYAVLSGLGEEPVRTQAALAAAIGADKSRVIPVLDDLQERGLISRRPDPADRRVRLVALTPEGRSVRSRVQAEIQRAEEELLERLSPDDRRAFLRTLHTLYESVRVAEPAQAMPRGS
ncbi:MarR family winged helix-turn-helix transcriptional regulator [Phytoactinopolyspora mesophila]|uniref:MarR family transcriptional regulator n=1 Tax=Phytoactinopolyspora mesophila TaxID=2650750 RepID=A0A7K3LZJ5_9ACTN|nr:MarR family transcriptional regulator [Phytoactinopolyspora mesophila]NDL56419.1 MarR family transcriptional regulator [Phytoactinopolyspora mesophila]